MKQFCKNVFLVAILQKCAVLFAFSYAIVTLLPFLSIPPVFHRAFGSSFTRGKQGLFLLVTYGRRLCHSLMNLICVC